jgi:hypothetical protein
MVGSSPGMTIGSSGPYSTPLSRLTSYDFRPILFCRFGDVGANSDVAIEAPRFPKSRISKMRNSADRLDHGLSGY